MNSISNQLFNLQKDHLERLFRTAAAKQTDIMVQNILGNGIDIPLLGLREASREVNGEYHELFTDDTYKIAQCFLLSTSQVKLVIKLSTEIALNVIFHLRKNCTIKLNSLLHKFISHIY